MARSLTHSSSLRSLPSRSISFLRSPACCSSWRSSTTFSTTSRQRSYRTGLLLVSRHDDPTHDWAYFLFAALVILLTLFTMEILSDIKSTSRSPPPFTCRTFLVQGMRIFIRLGSQLLTIVVVGLLVNKLFPTLHYTPISLPSSSVLFCRIADHTDTGSFVPGASLAHPPPALPSVARC